MEQANSLLIVCNKKSEAAYLYKALSNGTAHCFHLSAAMCMAHRRIVLNNLQAVLDALKSTLQTSEKKVICVSTQVIEAGVDISFERVIRLSAGMDSVIQSAGRCNRNGESNTPAPVYLVPCQNENLTKLSEIQREKMRPKVCWHNIAVAHSNFKMTFLPMKPSMIITAGFTRKCRKDSRTIA